MKNLQTPSLRARLLLWLLPPLLGLSLVMVVLDYRGVRDAANQAYDRVLLGSALAIADRVVVMDGALEVDVPYVALEMLTSAANDRVYYRVAGPGDDFITGYGDLPAVPGPARGSAPVFYDARYRGATIRVGAVSRVVSGPRDSRRFTVQVAETVQDREALLTGVLIAAASRQGLSILAVVVVVWLGIGKGLVPLSRLEAAVRRRGSSDLRPIRHKVPREVRHLVDEINSLLARLDSALQARQRFIANASHQLRTPLAALKTHTELALADTEPAARQAGLERLHGLIDHTARLSNQLLSLARAEHVDRAAAVGAVDLAALAAAVARDLTPTALERDIDLGFEGTPVPVCGEAVLLEELVRNLIDNALIYAGAGRRVTVRVRYAQGTALLQVEDNGPGIPDDQRRKVFERFHRVAGSPGGGSGLGLAIVREIAQAHGGAAATMPTPGGGLTVQVRLPAAH